ncbi:hypothetical protein COY95_01990 [Candidatus Woesearchaeota archaeon CG_4_10_14_0_8_um_filter_47_5]|nr:MAG: hypothetical protein COY95_01990 [Candidatus Woesearchaeota archaeon CG_4_10_14_0_8_um_filter_47_5]
MVTYVVDLKKLMKTTSRFLRRHDVPEHFSKTNNEQFTSHQMLVLFILYCLLDVGIDRFGEWAKIIDLSSVGLKRVPYYSTMWRAWRRFSPRFLRKLVRLSGRGGRDMCIAIDPTHFEITRPSMAYCKRTKRNPLQEPNRKTTLATGTRSLLIKDAVIHKDSHRHGLDDFAEIAGNWMANKTIVADTEFDAEDRFHQIVISFGGKGVAPLRHKGIPIWRTNGSRRKELRRKWPGKSYHRRSIAETLNSMLKRGMSARLRGRTVWQQARHFYAKCIAHNLMIRG